MIKNKITLKQIEALVCVADLGTFRKAATALGTTQPNISVRIAAIEDRLDVVLMHRDAGAVTMTEKGTEMLSAARDVLRSTESLLEVAGRRDLVEDKLRLGVTELVASTWLPSFLRALKQEYPSVRVELTVDLSRQIGQQLHSGELDLAVLTEDMVSTSLTSHPLGSNHYGWVASPKIAKDLGQNPDFARMFSHGLLTHSRHTKASKKLREHLESHALPVDQVTHSSSLAALIHMAADGMGIALMPRQLYQPQLSAGQLIEVASPWIPEPLLFVSCYNSTKASLYVEQAAIISTKIASDYEM